MSTFSGLGTALSSLIAQRQALDVAGQNIANANTVGYTRQRATLAALPSATVPSMFSTYDGSGQGTRVSSIDRLADAFLDASVRTQTSGASYLAARAEAYTTLETNVGEPATTGLANQLSSFWGAWDDVAKTADKGAAKAVLLEGAAAVVDRIGTLYTAAQTQWTHARTTTVALVDQVNTAAASIADLNGRIQQITNSGGTAHELADQRDLLVTSMSGLVGASVSVRPDGQVDVLVGGNYLVSGNRPSALAVTGAASFAQATGDAGAPGQPVTVVWADHPTRAAGLDGGRVAGLLSVLAPTDAKGTGGILTEAAARYDALATTIAEKVNTLHSGAVTVSGAPGGDFFAFTAGRPAALGLTVAVTDPSGVAVGAPGRGALDGSIGDAISRLGTAADGPDAAWSTTVVELGVRTASAASRAKVAESARSTAVGQQLAQASVDTDEETVNMLASQRAYEGAARVLTAIDEMLDTLINRTGLVGR
ncbi:flagellar hook-associated protein FlgK [Cellulomonas fengjieae]|uniref:Flagellar hook-associated protein 1 n=1 Tax=Cellulomonas fengjieae TaxID=2819978 RepID=A0ABS3SJ22_9CELL|nr:flagellar hook-associated protein FlgK [Cellulomonas fengjieae]MBO3084950.1 flagellar hook-associated protein FlgK [Cellulomonas fengjieae]MBO3100697.1 flagellar hook-associated protein FlgK [Cellulomonas fengjieae]QVI66449.1 flagellar hook-associated protein FlgK [Cellulomonas fengjieae]